jgi:hypothetical protein
MLSTSQIVPPENGPTGTTTGARDQSGEKRLYKLDSRSLPFFIRYMRKDLKLPPKPKERDLGYMETYFVSEQGDKNYMNRPFIDYLSNLTQKIRSFYCSTARNTSNPFEDFEVDRSTYKQISISESETNDFTETIEDISKQLFKAFSTGKDVIYTLNIASGRINNNASYRPQTALEIDISQNLERLNELINLYYESISNLTETQSYLHEITLRVTQAEINFSSTQANISSSNDDVDDWEKLADEPSDNEVELLNARAALSQVQFDLSNAELKKSRSDIAVRNYIQYIISSNFVEESKIEFFRNFISQLRLKDKKNYILSILPKLYLQKLNR